jgi:hypothetical protein
MTSGTGKAVTAAPFGSVTVSCTTASPSANPPASGAGTPRMVLPAAGSEAASPLGVSETVSGIEKASAGSRRK